MTAELSLGDVRLRGLGDRWIAEQTNTGVQLEGEGRWIISGAATALDPMEAALSGVCERLGREVLLVRFGNAIGRFPVPGIGTIEVVSGKWDETHFDSMLQDLTRVAATLPFSAASSGSLPYDRTVARSDDLLYHAFVYLRHVLSENAPFDVQLQPALREILREPQRRLTREVATVRLDQVRRVAPTEAVRVLQRPAQLIPVGGSLRNPLSDALGARLPERIGESQPRIDFDTAENRFVKTFLGIIEAVLANMADVVGRQKERTVFWRRIELEISDLKRAVRPVTTHALWRDVGRMTHLPANSTVLQQRRGYKQTFQHFVRLRLSSRLPVNENELRDLLEVKNIASLYELWCYFRLVELLTQRKGEPSSVSRLRENQLDVDVPAEFEVSWGDGTRVSYNPWFGPRQESVRRSYSLGLRPDIALEVRHGDERQLHLFDAKFRVDATPPSGEDDQAAPKERRGDFLQDDLYKMHAYRDAIDAAESVWIMYPGTETHFYAANGQRASDFQSVTLPLSGVGAVPLQPAGRGRSLIKLLAVLTD